MKQIIVIRKDLHMRRGKEIAQGAHASNAVLIDSVKAGKMDSDIKEWIMNGSKKVCVQVSSEAELLKVYQDACKAGLSAHIIRDAGHTEFNGVPTLTACAIGPNEDSDIDAVTGSLQLY